MTRLTLYSLDASPPCRAVLMTASALENNLNIVETKLFEGEHLKPEFIKINPQHTIPTLVDDEFILWDSHAIMTYLVNKYGKDDSLYPKDLQMRAKVDQFLHFETGYLFNTLVTIAKPMLYAKDTNVSAEKIELLNRALDTFEKLLDNKNWCVGNSYTLADISCVTTVSSLSVFRKLDKYPNIQSWVKRCEESLPGYNEKNTPGNQMFHTAVKNIFSSYL